MCVYVCLSVCLFSLEHSKHLKQDVSRVSQGCLLGVSRVFSGCSIGVLKMFSGYLKGVSRMHQGCFMGVSRLLQRYFKGKRVLRKLQENFNGNQIMSQLYFKEVLGCVNSITRVFQESCDGV